MGNRNLKNNRLQEIRNEKKVSLRDLSEKIGISHTTLLNVENGKRHLTDDDIKKLTEYFNVSSDYLLGLSHEHETIKKNRLYELRKERNLTLRELSDQIGIDYSALSKIEHQKRNLTDNDIRILTSFFNVSADYLLALKDEKNPYFNYSDIDVQIIKSLHFLDEESKEVLFNIIKQFKRINK